MKTAILMLALVAFVSLAGPAIAPGVTIGVGQGVCISTEAMLAALAQVTSDPLDVVAVPAVILDAMQC